MLSKELVRQQIEEKLKRKVASDPKLHQVHMLIHSDKLNIHWPMAAGKTDEAPVNPHQPFHTASVGKTFTSVIVAKLVERGLAKFEDPIARYLPSTILEGLHLFKGKDYTYDIQIKHLLNNTSGVPDYFEDKPKRHRAFMQDILEDPSRFWTAEETIQWSKQHLEPRFPPGKGIHYTDTGYNLLGLIIESITSKPYHEILHDYIFRPLQMRHSYLSHYSESAVQSEYPVAHVYLNHLKVNVNEYRSFSSFYAGGQAVCTTEDLLLFMKALVENRLVKPEILNAMQNWNKMWPGMEYGYGLMRMRFIPFTQKYLAWGHLGASGAFMLYFPNLDVYAMGSFNQTAYRSKSMNYLFFNVLRKVSKID